MESLALSQGKDFSSLSLDEKDELWNEVKSTEPAGTPQNPAVEFALPLQPSGDGEQ